MDEFWWGVIITLIVGIPGAYIMSVLAHMHTPKFVQFLESRRLLKTHKTRQQALRPFYRIRAFRDGTRDRYAFYIILASGAVISAIVACALFFILSQAPEYPLPIEYGVPLFLGPVASVLSLGLLSGIYETARQIERYDDYKKELEERWGPIDEAPRV
jgi:hypothetical protein